jgi:hypothetical protein
LAGLRKRLRVVEMRVPWTELMAELTGDQIHDEPIILNFARRMGVSRRTIDTKIQLHSKHPYLRYGKQQDCGPLAKTG